MDYELVVGHVAGTVNGKLAVENVAELVNWKLVVGHVAGPVDSVKHLEYLWMENLLLGMLLNL